MKNVLLFFAVYSICSASSAQEVTSSQKVQRIQYDGVGQSLYFVGESKWAAPGCPSATYVQVKGSEVPGIKEIMSLGLSAKMSEKR